MDVAELTVRDNKISWDTVLEEGQPVPFVKVVAVPANVAV
jgi:hypothetical protein